MVECPLPAGCEAREEQDQEDDPWLRDEWYQRLEMRDDLAAAATSRLRGESELILRLRPTHAGTWHLPPAVAFAMYAPDMRGESGGMTLTVVDR